MRRNCAWSWCEPSNFGAERGDLARTGTLAIELRDQAAGLRGIREADALAYRARQHQSRYAECVSLQTLRDNDYNLNIPRYVDTFEEEEAVNLRAVAKELKKLDADMQATNTTIAAYCKELGIETPF